MKKMSSEDKGLLKTATWWFGTAADYCQAGKGDDICLPLAMSWHEVMKQYGKLIRQIKGEKEGYKLCMRILESD